MPEIVRGEVMAEILQFRTKRLTGFIPEDEQLETESRPEQTSAKPVADTAPCEMGQEDSGDCV
jgi:hypothetical protein